VLLRKLPNQAAIEVCNSTIQLHGAIGFTDEHDIGVCSECGQEFSLAEYVELKPDFLESYFNRGLTYVRLKKYKQAISDHTKVLEINPNLVEAYYTRGLIREYLKDYDSAIRDYSRALELNPNYEDAKEQRKIAYRKKIDSQ